MAVWHADPIGLVPMVSALVKRTPFATHNDPLGLVPMVKELSHLG